MPVTIKTKYLLIAFIGTALGIFFLPAGAVYPADEIPRSTAQAIAGQPTASSGLAQKERTALERQYQYEVRQKDLLLNPYTMPGAPFAGGAVSALTAGQSEEEKLHGYFGIAIGLYKEGRPEEAAEILQYISDKTPDDTYVKEYLARIKKETASRQRRFDTENAIEAARIKRNKAQNLVADGIAYYNSKDLDRALLTFSDALALDPYNPTAGRYMDKLKKFYSKELEVQNIVQSWVENKSVKKEAGEAVSGQRPDETTSSYKIKEAAEKLLSNEKDGYGAIDDRAGAMLDSVEKQSGNEIMQAAEKLLDDKKMKELLVNKRAASLLNNIELEDRIKEIIYNKWSEGKKAMQFTLGPGDVIQVAVRDHPELSGKSMVQLSGDIILPLVNDSMPARGLTIDELTEKVTEVLKRYVQDPYVRISIIEYKSKMFYVIDENSCTPYPITRAYLTLRDALFISDWGNNRALGRVLVIKPSMRNPVIKRVDAFELIYRGKLENDVRIEDGDVIYVPMTIMAKITKTVFDTVAPFRAIRAARDEYLNLKWNEQDWKSTFRVPPIYEEEAEDAKNLSRYGSLTDLLWK